MADPSTVRRVAVLWNVRAGPSRQRQADTVRATLAQAFAAHGIEAEIVPIDSVGLREAAATARAQAENGEIDALVVAGGDGSIRFAAGVLAGTSARLGVIPLGTRNHLAKDLGIPLDIAAAAATIAAGHERAIDIGEVNGETFINTSSIGIYPYMVIDRERRRQSGKLGKWTATTLAFFRMLHHFPKRRLRIRAGDLARPYRTPCLFVGNNEYGIDLFSFGDRPRLDTGALWFYVLKPANAWELFLTVCRLCLGHPDPERDLDMFKLREAEIDAKTSRLPVALDGDVLILHPPLHYRSRPGALRVIVPVAPLRIR